jgi:hypothetical protein
MSYIYNLADTWNAGGTTFTGIGLNVTDTTSAATSMLIDLQVGGTTQFHVLKNGAVHTKRSNYNITNTNAASILVSNYSLTGSDATSMFDLAGTWNTSGTPTAIKMNVTDTASNAASLLMDLQVGSLSKVNINKGAGFTINQNTVAGPTDLTGKVFKVVAADATNARYDSYTFNADNLLVHYKSLGTAAAPTALTSGTRISLFAANGYDGTSAYNRTAQIEFFATENFTTTAAGGRIVFATTANTTLTTTKCWMFEQSGAFLPFADNTFDIGSGAARTRNAFIAGYMVFTPIAVANLPAAATAGAGARMFVNNALTPVFGSAVVGGGAVTVPVYSTGSAWNVG